MSSKPAGAPRHEAITAGHAVDHGAGHDIDHGVVAGYPVSRVNAEPLVLGAGSRLRTGTVLYDGSTIGRRLQTGHGVVIREGCEVGDDVSVWTNSVIDYGCRIGNRVKIHCNCYIAQYSQLDDEVFLAPGVTIANDLYPGDPRSAELMAGPRICAGARIGVNTTILPFVRIGAGALIGAGSVVTRDIPPGVVAFGNPAVPHRTVGELPDIDGRVVMDTASASPYRLTGGGVGRGTLP